MKVSVVMGVYIDGAQSRAGGALLRETLDSILAQTFSDFELVLVDDGSSEPIRVDDPRVRVIRKEENRGLTRALIDGCAAARGEYIARHDAGDLSHPTRLEKQAALLDANRELAFVSCHTELVGPQRERMLVHRGKERAAEPVDILDLNERHGVIDGPTSHGSVMFRRDAYERAGGYRAAFYYGQDWDLWYRLAAVGKFQILPEVLYTMRVSPDAISMTARGPQSALARLSREALTARSAGQSEEPILARAATITKAPKPFCARAHGLYFIGEALRRNGDARARGYLLQAVLSCPLLVKSWLRLAQSLAIR